MEWNAGRMNPAVRLDIVQEASVHITARRGLLVAKSVNPSVTESMNTRSIMPNTTNRCFFTGIL